MSYQYNIEVVNAVPPEALDGTHHKLTLRCVRRDASFDCFRVPATFEVRNAPGYDLLECALVSVDETNTVIAHSGAPIVMGGPHRMMGAVWVPLEEVSAASAIADGDGGSPLEGSAPTSSPVRVFVAWSMTNLDGSPINASALELPPVSNCSRADENNTMSVSPRASIETSPLGCGDGTSTAATAASTTTTALPAGAGMGPMMTPVSVLTASSSTSTSSRRMSAASGPHNGDTLPATCGSGAESSAFTAHVSIVLDAAQEAAQQQREEEEGEATDRHGVPSLAGVGGEDSGRLSASATQHIQEIILTQFPKCSVSSSFSLPPEEAVEQIGGATGKEAEEAAAAVGAGAAKYLNYFAGSTQSIGDVPLERRHGNLRLVPCPLLLDKVRSEMQPAFEASSSFPPPLPAHGAGQELWKVSHKNSAISRQLGASNSAVESILQEYESRQKALLTSAEKSSTSNERAGMNVSSSATVAAGNGGYGELRGVSSLAVLRQQAMANIRQRRVTYQT